MKYEPASRGVGMQVAREFKQKLIEHDIPVINVFLFGSLAKGGEHAWSDIDIAVVHQPFSDSRMHERRTIRSLQTERRFPIDVICLHPEDLENMLWGVAQEVKTHGLPM